MSSEIVNKMIEKLFVESMDENERLNVELEKLKQEYARLKQEYSDQFEILLNDKNQMKWEINKLREALKHTSPLNLEDVVGYCLFCGYQLEESGDGHKNDCEYVRLTKG